MSQVVENIKKQQEQLNTQRLQVQDVLTNIEKQLGEINNVLSVLEAVDREREAADAGPLLSEDELRADIEAENSRPPLD